jgi:hypothetical protein
MPCRLSPSTYRGFHSHAVAEAVEQIRRQQRNARAERRILEAVASHPRYT